VIEEVRCTACRLGAIGVPQPIASLLGLLPVQFLNQESTSPLSRAFTARAMTNHFKKAWDEMIGSIDKIHVYADWVEEMVLKNGARREQLVLFRTGGPWQIQMKERKLQQNNGKLQLVYSGRCDEVKGVHLLVKAVKSLPSDYPVEVSFYGPYWDTQYGKDLLAIMRDDRRFKSPEVVPNSQMQARLSEADLCIVPSIWLETGPLVVLEAFAAGVPVVGSRLGGIAELVRDGTDGMLFAPGDSMDLSRIIQTLAGDRARLSALKRGVHQPRTMSDVARDTAAVYEQLLTEF
jgi:glycosyltransferase involved in cell wall biosynthesis